MFTATLIAAEALSAGDVSAARDRLAEAGCVPAGWAWLDEGSAADIAFGINLSLAREALETGSWDVVIQPLEGREKRLLVADMDSTMITVECIDELADYAGIKPRIAAITELGDARRAGFRGRARCAGGATEGAWTRG